MVIQLQNQPVLPRSLSVQASRTPRFGSNAASTAAETAVKEVAHLNIAKNVMKGIERLGITKDIRVGGMSMEDISGRLQTLIGVYMLQGYFAYKDKKHPWETNGRNAVVWLMTVALSVWSKSDSYGINTMVFNHFMKAKGTPNKIPMMQSLLDWARMDTDYLKILEAANIDVPKKDAIAARSGKKALWAASWLDSNKVKRIQRYLQEIEQKAPGTLDETELAMKKAIPQFFKRMNVANMASTAVITAATVYLIGNVAMQIVNKLFTPLDKDTGMLNMKPTYQPSSEFKPWKSAPIVPYQPGFAYRPQPLPYQPFQPFMPNLITRPMPLYPQGGVNP